MSAKKSDEAIPLKVLEMAIVMVNAADQCDQAGQLDRDHRRACRHILDWYNSNDYKITCDKAGAKVAKHGKWIPCSERLPEDNAEVLVSFCGRYVKIGYIEPGDGLRYWVIPGHSVVHLDYIEAWMPLPEPPEKEDADDT